MNAPLQVKLISLEQALKLLGVMGKELYGGWCRHFSANNGRPSAKGASEMLDLLDAMGKDAFNAMIFEAFGGDSMSPPAAKRQRAGPPPVHVTNAAGENDLERASSTRPPQTAAVVTSSNIEKPSGSKGGVSKRVNTGEKKGSGNATSSRKSKKTASRSTPWLNEVTTELGAWVTRQSEADPSVGTKELAGRAQNELGTLLAGRTKGSIEYKIRSIRQQGDDEVREVVKTPSESGTAERDGGRVAEPTPDSQEGKKSSTGDAEAADGETDSTEEMKSRSGKGSPIARQPLARVKSTWNAPC